MQFSVILCTYKRPHLLARTLASLSVLKVPDNAGIEFLIIDNNSNDETPEVVKRWLSQLPGQARYLFQAKQGKAAALNLGLSQAQGDWLCFTDDDVLIDRDWLHALAAGIRQHPDAAGFGGKVIPRWPEEKPRWLETMGSKRLKIITSY